jgi:nitrite reductase/ring-hydroxylating ferredoxin subunit/uncharacterized membrane protein
MSNDSQGNISSSGSLSLPEHTLAEAAMANQAFVEKLSDDLQNVVKRAIGANRRPPRRLKSLLHGTQFGHPLHPAITDVPIGAWLLTVILDIIWLVSPVATGWAARGAEVTVLVGLVAALGAAITGLADWSDSYGAERATGLLHGLLNVTATILYAVSAGIRFTTGSGESAPAAILGFIGLVIVIYAAYLGGDMVFTLGTGVNHTAWEAASEDFEAVMPLADVAEHRLYRVMAAGVPVVLMRQGQQVYAISATCSHAGGPLDEGTLDGDVVECPWHGSRFCLRDGRVLTGPATANAPRYEVRVRNGQVEIRRAGRP